MPGLRRNGRQLFCRWCRRRAYLCMDDPCRQRMAPQTPNTIHDDHFEWRLRDEPDQPSGNEGGDDLPTTTTTQTEVPETQRVLIESICQHLLSDRSTEYGLRQLAAQIVAHEVDQPMALIDFMGAIGLQALHSIRSNYGGEMVRETLGRMNISANTVGRIAISAGFSMNPTCSRCGMSLNVGVTCGDCNYTLRVDNPHAH